MITHNPFADIPAALMQLYVVIMALLVVGGTIIDTIHKKSAQYFFANAEKAKQSATRDVGFGEKVMIAVATLINEVMLSGEFENPRRRISHLLMMYGLVMFIVTTIIMVFVNPADGLIPLLWHVGALMVCVGGYWFFFSIRADVGVDGNPWYRLHLRADMFIVSLLGTVTFGLLWSLLQGAGVLGTLFFVLFMLSSLVLFGGVLWSKFSHMFFKPAAAYQKRITRADGSRENLPEIGDLSDPEIHARYPDIPEYMGEKPAYMGPGIKREQPRHF
jgi:hypothetical protein